MNVLPTSSSMLGTLRMDRVFLEYEAPALFSVINHLAHRYLALSVDQEPLGDVFLYVPVSDRRLFSVAAGTVSLRSAFGDPETDSVFVVRPHLGDESSVIELPRAEINEAWLPHETAFLSEPVSARTLADVLRSR